MSRSRSARVLVGVLLLLGGSLALAALFLPWWTFTQETATPFAIPSETGTVTPALAFGLVDTQVAPLLGCTVVAIGVGAVSLVMRRRPPGWLAPVTALVGLAGLGLAYLTTSLWFVDAGVLRVLDDGYYLYSFGCVLMLAGAGTMIAT